MRAWVLLAAAAMAGCLETSFDVEGEAPFILEPTRLHIAAPAVEGDFVLALNLVADDVGSCHGQFRHTSDGERTFSTAYLDTAGESWAMADVSILTAAAGPVRAGLYFETPPIMGGQVDPGQFSGSRWVWLAMAGVVPEETIGGVAVDVACTGARIEQVLGGTAVAAMHWEQADVAAIVLADGAYVAAGDPARLEVGAGERGIMALFPQASRGATTVTGSGDAVVFDHADGFALESLSQGSHDARTVSVGAPAFMAMAAAGNVTDWTGFLRL